MSDYYNKLPNLPKLTKGQIAAVCIGSIFGFFLLCYLLVLGDIKLLNSYFHTNLPLIFEKIAQPENRDCLYNYGGIFVITLFISIFLFVISTDPRALTDRMYIYLFLILIPILVGFAIFLPLSKNIQSEEMIFAYGTALIIFVFVVFYFYSSINGSTLFFGKYIINFISFLIILFGLAMVYKMLNQKITNMPGWGGFILRFLFFLPCLAGDAVEYLANQFKITPNIVFILFVIEILLALLYIYVPKLIHNMIKSNSILLLNKPVFLDKEILLNTQQLQMNPLVKDPNNIKKINLNNYSITMWIYLNPQSSSNTSYASETTIFKYGNGTPSANGKPKITYKNDPKTNKDTYSIYLSDGLNAKFDMVIPNQKWNYFAFNYNNTSADLFLNGKLVRSFPFTDNYPTYALDDTITVGSDNGLYGSICNINYFTKPLTEEEIVKTYNLYMFQNPPLSF